jgi:hypothetical protein
MGTEKFNKNKKNIGKMKNYYEKMIIEKIDVLVTFGGIIKYNEKLHLRKIN